MYQNRRVRILAHGSFGSEVAGHLTELSAAGECATLAGTPSGSRLQQFLADGTVGILASSRDVAPDLDAFAAAASQARVAWLPVVLGPHRARIGPFISSQAVPCHTCYSTRLAQHEQLAGPASEDSGRAAARDGALRLAGYPPHIAAIAAGLALGIVRSLTRAGPGGRAGWLFSVDVANDAVTSWKVIMVQGCPECDSPANSCSATAERAERLRSLAAEICPPPSG